MKKLNIYIDYRYRDDENSIMGYPFWFKMITDFSQVEELTVDISDHRDITNYHDFIEVCPKIKEFKLRIDRHYVPRSQYKKRRYFGSLVPNTTITILEVQHSFLRKPDLNYSMKKFKELKSLYII
ncbi:hypothetical protein CU098_006779 [Rhizopus stolonifer]|uniref:Uncharacterized protein n=1 Tax=Rhizopus stolonifer TaxID=4846 RepID=A0A367IKQ0_RHIST|nr:hypothetical protein CU098_006779 [Rhizopus stolonifer]